MRALIALLSSFCIVLAHFEGPIPFQKRYKRDAVGALDIVTNNAQPIHADVKIENIGGENGVAAASTTEKPCPKPYVPSSIEMGTVFQLNTENSVVQKADISVPSSPVVTPPKDVTVVKDPYPVKSLRKSWPLVNRLDMIRSVTRIMTLSVLIVSAILEFYPLIQHVYSLYAEQ